MASKASIRMVRITPRKMRVVVNQIRGKDVQKALDYLTFCKRHASKPLIKLIKSAVANADHAGGVDVDNLYIKEILVNMGPTMKRWMPRAKGMATPVLKRSSRVNVVLDER